MLHEYKTPRKVWPEAIDTACHIINRVYLHKLLNKTSYELLTGKKTNVSYFRVFGARCWIKDPHHTSKFAPKAHEGFMLGYGKDRTPIESSTSFTIKWLKLWMCSSMRLTARKESTRQMC